MQQAQKIKQYETFIIKGYSEKFEERKDFINSEIRWLKSNFQNFTTKAEADQLGSQLQSQNNEIRNLTESLVGLLLLDFIF